MQRDRGIVHVAIASGNPGFLNQSLRSIVALRTFSDLPVTVFTSHARLLGEALSGVPAVEVVPLKAFRSPFKLKVEAQLRAPYARHLFLDTDTYPLADPSDLLDGLDTRDLLLANAPRHAPDPADPTGRRTVVSGCDGQDLNTGVFALRKSEAMCRFLELWSAAVGAVPDAALSQYHGDQLYFNRLYHAGRLQALGVSLGLLDNRIHNVRPRMLPFLREDGALGRVRILHVKHPPPKLLRDYPEFAGNPGLEAAARVQGIPASAMGDRSG